jgi:polygalacturonase
MSQFTAAKCRWLAVLIALSGAATAMAGTDRSIDLTAAGVVGDGATLNTTQIQKAIDDCSAAGGGTLRFPAGRYLTGTIQVKSHVTLQLDDGATLLGSTNAADYRNADPFIDGSGNPMGHALIVAVDADHVGIEGNGTVDGQSPKLKASEKPYTVRPFLIRWVRCANVTMRAVHLINPGAWTVHFFEVKDASVEGVTIRSRGLGMPNNDGIDVDSSQNVRLHNCDIISGDDSIVIKSTGALASRDIVASDCKLSSHTNAIKLGTESFGGFENIAISNCQINKTDMCGIALYAVDGGDLRNVSVSDITIDGVRLPIGIRLGARLKTFRSGEQPKPVGVLSNVTIKNVTARNIGLVGMLINGVPGHPVEAVTLENIQLELPGGGSAEAAKVHLAEKVAAYPEYNMFGKSIPAYGIYARHVRGIHLQNVRMTTLHTDARPATVFIDVEEVTPIDFASHVSKTD